MSKLLCRYDESSIGEMAEWSNAADSKSVVLIISGPGVRIPLSPLACCLHCFDNWLPIPLKGPMKGLV